MFKNSNKMSKICQLKYFLLTSFISAHCLVNAQSIRDIQKIRDEIKSLGIQSDNTDLNRNTIDNELIDRSTPVEVLIKPKDIADYYKTELERLKQIKDELIKLSDTTTYLLPFGYDYFVKRDSVYFTDNKKINTDYVLGSGDEILITMWGDAELNIKKVINKNGSVFIDNVGQISLSGKSINEALKVLKKRFSVKYSTLESLNPTTFIDISVGKLNPININMLGSVNLPGTHLVHPNSTIISSLIQTGGIANVGSLRNIQLIRGGIVLSKIDLYDYLIFGNTKTDLTLLDNDVILIPSLKNRVTITGAVFREGYFEFKEGENLNDLLKFCLGVRKDFSGDVHIDRTEFNSNVLNKKRFSKNIYEDSDLKLAINDSIHFVSSPEFVPKVYIRGQVLNPGEITLVENMSIFDLLKQAGGIDNPSFIKTMDLTRAEFVSRNENSRLSDVRIINIENILNGDYQQNYILQPFDEISIYPNKNYIKIENVRIMGEVIFPGSYTLNNNKTSLQELINRSGGYSDRAFEEGIKIFRDSSQVVWSNLKFNLFPGDSIYVPQKPGVVSVKGEIYNPGYIEFRNNLSLKDYINSAGGFTPKADQDKVIIIYPNGNVKRKNFFFYPKVKEGSTILVNEKDVNGPFDWLSLATTTINLSTSIATILVLINQTQSSQ